MLKFFFLINPISGGGQGKIIEQYLPEIMKSMDFAPSEWRAELTKMEGMREQIENALNETETLIAVGGDGTVSSVFTAMLNHERRSEVKIGLIPLGTGNDLARVLGLYKPFVEKGLLFLLRRLLLADSKKFDIWKVNGTTAFANYFSAGIDARIAHDFNTERSSGKINSNSVFINKLHYVKSFFADRNYFLRRGSLSITDKNGILHQVDLAGARTIIVGNIPSFASGSNPFFKSNVSDGLLEVVTVPNMPNFLGAIALGNIPLIGFLYKKYFLKSFQGRALQFSLPESEFLQLDGEDLTGKTLGNISIEYGFSAQLLMLKV